jgi:hypothetical protein
MPPIMNHDAQTFSKVSGTAKRRKIAESDSVGRRQQLLLHLAREFPPGIFSPTESMAILFGPLDLAKRAMEAARVGLVIGRTGMYSLNQPSEQNGSILVPRPSHTLSRLNRGCVFPPNVPPVLQIRSPRLTVVLNDLRKESAQNVPPLLLLDRLATGLNLNWLVAAKLLGDTKIISQPIDELDIIITRRARQFWIRYAEGRAGFGAFIRIKRARLSAGDWALFSHQQLEALLPNVILPDHARRSNYLSNYIHGGDCLDLYSETWLPLVRHPFPSRFNPLVFGRAKQLTFN